VPHKDACLLSDEQARQALGFCFPELLFRNKEFSDEIIWKLWRTFARKIQKLKKTWK